MPRTNPANTPIALDQYSGLGLTNNAIAIKIELMRCIYASSLLFIQSI